MPCTFYRDSQLYIENVSLKSIAEKFGTPAYIYSKSAIENNWRQFDKAFAAFPHRICYAVKANSNLAILNLLAKLNSGFDIVSVGELHRVIAAGGDPKKIIFSGVGKKQNEIEQAIEREIYCFNVESEAELERLYAITTQLNAKVNIAFRINPNIDPRTHSHISTGLQHNKFGIEIDEVLPLSLKLKSMSTLNLIGIACHIGSQIVELEPFVLAIERLLSVYDQLSHVGIKIQNINLGGGLGITYHHESPPAITEYAAVLEEKIANYPLEILLEPGRAIVGNTGILLTRIEYLKHNQYKNFAIVDAGMNDFVRPALYDAWHDIFPVERRDGEPRLYDVAGPVCESADFLGKDRKLAVYPGDLLAVDAAGAYGFSMTSNYNSRCRPCEVLINNTEMQLIRRREVIEDLLIEETLSTFEEVK